MNKLTILGFALIVAGLFGIIAGCGDNAVDTMGGEVKKDLYQQHLKVVQVYTSNTGDVLNKIIFDEQINTNFLDSLQQRILNTGLEVLYTESGVYTTMEFKYVQSFYWNGNDTYTSFWVINNNYLALNNINQREGIVNLGFGKSYIVENYVTLSN